MEQSNKIRWEDALFWLLLIIHILPVLQNKYFLTGDGPSHVYNAKVVLDYVQGNNWDFYAKYYDFNANLEPNWLSHVLLAGLISIFPDFLADKILVFAYLLLFAFGWRFLLRQINPQNAFIILIGLPFMYQRTFQMGFYNYSLSIALMFWVVGYWVKYKQELTVNRLLILMLLWLLLYFAHPVGLTLSWLLIGLLLVMELLTNGAFSGERLKFFFIASAKVMLAALPAIGLLGAYMIRRGSETTPNPFDWAHMGRKFVELTSLVNLTNREINWAIAWSILIGILFIFGLIYKIRKKEFTAFDGFFIAFLITLAMYFLQPGSIGGAGILYIRLQFIPFLMVLMWVAAIPFRPNSIYRYSFSAFFISTVIIALRAPHHRLASVAVQEYLEVREHIPDRSTVLPLSFAHQGITPEGKNVAKRIWLFMHAADYLGSDRSLVMLGNYEAGLGYFPLIWKADKQPYVHLGVRENIEGRPPAVDLISYPEKTGGSVDYVLTWCIEGGFKDHPNTVDLRNQLEEAYEEVFRSSNGLAVLYKKN